jgi:hypothetical protein
MKGTIMRELIAHLCLPSRVPDDWHDADIQKALNDWLSEWDVTFDIVPNEEHLETRIDFTNRI